MLSFLRRPSPAPALLFYCQHSLGIGHLTRSFALARALAGRFRVIFLNGGPIPEGLPVPQDIEVVDLPPLGMDAGHRLVSRDATRSVAEARALRRELLLAAVARHAPAMVLVELFPFGRKKFTDEILAMVRAALRQPRPARIVCSLRDILVDSRENQQRFDDRARWLANRYCDAVLVHSDPGFARIEDSFRPSRPLTVPLHYTGYVAPRREAAENTPREAHLLVSAGGGIVGFPLFAAALAAHTVLWPRHRMPMRIIAGPFLPEAEWQCLRQCIRDRDDITLVRQVPDMVAEMRRARVSLSQCGYNTALDLVVSGVPALVVPYAAEGENEQSRRAQALAHLGAVRQMPDAQDDAAGLADAVSETLEFQPRPAALALDGAERSAELLHALSREAHH